MQYKGNDDQFIGKRIAVKSPRDGSNIVGVCTFIGYNKYLNNVPQATVGNMPVFPVDLDDIIVLKDGEMFDIRFHKFKNPKKY
jgi:hypothetical protein